MMQDWLTSRKSIDIVKERMATRPFLALSILKIEHTNTRPRRAILITVLN